MKRQLANGGFNYVIEEYREDGTMFSNSVYTDPYSRNETSSKKYAHDGKTVESHKYTDSNGNICFEKYFPNGDISRKDIYSKTDKKMIERTIYDKTGNIYLHNQYDENGKILNSEKNENSLYNENLDKKRLDGKFDTDIRQGKSSLCYLASTLKGFSYTEKGQKFLEKVVTRDKKNEERIVRLGNPVKEYRVSAKEIEEGYGRLSTGDPDYTAFLLGYESYRSETFGKAIDNGTADEVIYAMTGKKPITNLIDGKLITGISNSDYDNLCEMMKSKDTVVVIGTANENLYTEMSKEDESKGIYNNHALTLKSITNEKATIYDSLTGVESEISREEFLKKFVYFSAYTL